MKVGEYFLYLLPAILVGLIAGLFTYYGEEWIPDRTRAAVTSGLVVAALSFFLYFVVLQAVKHRMNGNMPAKTLSFW